MSSEYIYMYHHGLYVLNQIVDKEYEQYGRKRISLFYLVLEEQDLDILFVHLTQVFTFSFIDCMLLTIRVRVQTWVFLLCH